MNHLFVNTMRRNILTYSSYKDLELYDLCFESCDAPMGVELFLEASGELKSYFNKTIDMMINKIKEFYEHLLMFLDKAIISYKDILLKHKDIVYLYANSEIAIKSEKRMKLINRKTIGEYPKKVFVDSYRVDNVETLELYLTSGDSLEFILNQKLITIVKDLFDSNISLASVRISEFNLDTYIEDLNKFYIRYEEKPINEANVMECFAYMEDYKVLRAKFKQLRNDSFSKLNEMKFNIEKSLKKIEDEKIKAVLEKKNSRVSERVELRNSEDYAQLLKEFELFYIDATNIVFNAYHQKFRSLKTILAQYQSNIDLVVDESRLFYNRQFREKYDPTKK